MAKHWKIPRPTEKEHWVSMIAVSRRNQGRDLKRVVVTKEKERPHEYAS